jgi:Ca2+-binding EF-hand superfamily protein
MNRAKLIQDIANNLKEITVSLETLIEVLDKTVNKEEVSTTKTFEEAIPKAGPITLEKVRGVLASKSQSGKQPEVKKLIAKFGAKKLTDIDPDCYEELLKEAEVL